MLSRTVIVSCCCHVCCVLQLRRSFDALDQDHDGFITSADLLNLQQQLLGQHHMTKELAEDMMSEVSTCISDTHDGKMDFEEVGGWVHPGDACCSGSLQCHRCKALLCTPVSATACTAQGTAAGR